MNRIRYAKLSDVNVIKDIIDDAISIDYYSQEDIEKYINDNNCLFFIYVDSEDNPIACLLCEKGKLEEICNKDNIPYPDACFDSFNPNDNVIIYKTAATRKQDRNNGILADFLKQADVISRGIDHALKLCLCLILPNNKIPVHSNVIKAGFKQIKRVKSPWIHINSYCSYCKNQFCKCDGMVYIKENVNE